MEKLRILIVEDERDHIDLLRMCIKHSKYISENYDYSITEAMTYDDAMVCLYEQGKFDISILDYKLPAGKTGALLVENTKLIEEKIGQVIYTTQYEEHNAKFHELKASSNYLVLNKPFYVEDVEEVFKDSIRLKYVKNRKFATPLILWKGSRKIEIYDRYNIAFVQSAGKTCDYYLIENDKLMPITAVSGTLQEHTDYLKNTGLFLRVHNKYLVNVFQIRDGDKNKNPVTGKYSRKTGWLSFVKGGTQKNRGCNINCVKVQ